MMMWASVRSRARQHTARALSNTNAFYKLRIPPNLVSTLETSLRVTEPSPPQLAALAALVPPPPSQSQLPRPPDAVMLRFPTGSGKTLAYALPLLARLQQERYDGAECLRAVVVCPTRELALQTLRTLQKLTRHGRSNKKGNRLVVGSCMGRITDDMGVGLRLHPPTILVGTPQPLGLLLYAGVLPMIPALNQRYLILDEVDTLCQPHRWPHVARILSAPAPLIQPGYARGIKDLSPLNQMTRGMDAMPEPPSMPGVWSRASIWMVSASASTDVCNTVLRQAAFQGKRVELACDEQMPGTVRHVMLLPDPPTIISIIQRILYKGRGDGQRSASHRADAAATTSGDAAAASEEAVDATLRYAEPRQRKVLIFARSHMDAQHLEKRFAKAKIPVSMIVGGKSTAERGHLRGRSSALRAFKGGATRVLVVSDMMAHGVDIQGATHIVMQAPDKPEQYLHRAGRVGRLGGSYGTVVTLTSSVEDVERMKRIADKLKIHLETTIEPEVDLRAQLELASARGSSDGVYHGVHVDDIEDDGVQDEPEG